MATKRQKLVAYGEVKKLEPKKTNNFFLQKMYDHQNLQDADVC